MMMMLYTYRSTRLLFLCLCSLVHVSVMMMMRMRMIHVQALSSPLPPHRGHYRHHPQRRQPQQTPLPRHNPAAATTTTTTKAKSMTSFVQITSGGVEFQPRSPYAEVSSAVASLRYYPRDSALQTVSNLQIHGGNPEPDAILSSGSSDMPLDLLWEFPRCEQFGGGSCDFQVSAVVETHNAVVPIKHKVPFPVVSSPDQVPAEYLRVGMIANRNTQIQRLAQTLTAGHDDLYHAVGALADWVTTHIQYHCSNDWMMMMMMMEHTSPFLHDNDHHDDNYNNNNNNNNNIQSAAQVLQSGFGKCDEMTALFVSLNRAVGIPARFVSGYHCNSNSITDDDDFDDIPVRRRQQQQQQGGDVLQQQQDWTPHAWAEVWFPDGTGWVPFDVTGDGEYGSLTAGYIMMSVSDDAQTTTVDYNGRGHDFDMFVSDIFDTTIIPKQQITTTPSSSTTTAAAKTTGEADTADISTTTTTTTGDRTVELMLKAAHSQIDFGDTITLLVTIQNPNDYYVSTRLLLGDTADTKLITHNAATATTTTAAVTDDDATTTTSRMMVSLNPHEERTISYQVEINPNLEQRGYKYEFPFVISTTCGQIAETVVVVKEKKEEHRQQQQQHRQAGQQQQQQQHANDYVDPNAAFADAAMAPPHPREQTPPLPPFFHPDSFFPPYRNRPSFWPPPLPPPPNNFFNRNHGHFAPDIPMF